MVIKNKKYVVLILLVVLTFSTFMFTLLGKDKTKNESSEKVQKVERVENYVVKSSNSGDETYKSVSEGEKTDQLKENKNIGGKTKEQTKENSNPNEDRVVQVKGVDKSKKNCKKKASTACVGCEAVVSSSVVDKYKVQLTLENTSDGVMEIRFPSSQEYEYKIKDSKGAIFYIYSQDKSFSQKEHKKVLKINEKLVYDIDLKSDFEKNGLPKGDYIVEFSIKGYVGPRDLQGLLTVVNMKYE